MRGRTGSPGFRGERLRQAREARGLTAVGLAELLNITRQALAQYENASRTPGPEILEGITKQLRMPTEFFFKQPPAETGHGGPIFYRSLMGATKTERQKAERRFGWLKELTVALNAVVEFPKPNLPAIRLPERPEAISDEAIEEVAATLRSHWGMDSGPAPDLISLSERNGIFVSRFTMEAHDLDAFSQADGSGTFVVLNADKDSSARLRLDAAHEIGHQLIHRNIDPILMRRPDIHKLMERQAFRFAGAFLLPAESFLDEVDFVTLEFLKMLKRSWGVSIGAMLIRLQDLEVISDEEAHRFWRSYGMRGFRKREPLDDELILERPTLFVKAAETIGGPRALARILRAVIPLPENVCEELLGLPSGYLSEQPQSPVVSLRPSSPGPTSDEIGDLVQFPGTVSRDIPED